MPASFHRIYPIIGSPLEDITVDVDVADLDFGDMVYVRTKADFPAPVAGVITLQEGRTYQVTGVVDLGGDRIYSPNKAGIVGYSPETCKVVSALPAGQSLITAEDTFQLRNIALETSAGAFCISQDGTGKTNAVADWVGVNFVGGIAGELTNLDNFIALLCAVLPPCDGFRFYGTFNAVALELTIITLTTAGYKGVFIDPSATINRRFRYFNGPIVAAPSTTGLDIQPASIVNSEGMILSYVNFSGGGTYLSGIDYLSEKARFRDCRGIRNSSRVGQFYWNDAVLATTIPSAGTYVKINAVTTLNGLTQRFTHTNNRLTYTSDFSTDFVLSGTISVSSGNNQIISIAMYKNGVYVAGSEQKATTTGTGRADNISIQGFVTLQKNDYIEFFITNNSGTASVVASDGNLLIREV